MIVFETLRKVNRYVKLYKKNQAGKYLSPVRRIERVYPLLNEKLCAMTFDDGPSALEPNPNPINLVKLGLTEPNTKYGLTEVLLTTLNKFDAIGTFDCIGSTASNYPDKSGPIHTAKWGGTKHDHYPDIEMDDLAGLMNQKALGSKILDQGHEIANHGSKHVIFGPMRLIYDSRHSFNGIEEVLADLAEFHNYVFTTYGVAPTLSRPPHYIDPIKGGFTAYDAYAMTGYQYMAASFDGGGWKPTSGDYQTDVANMVKPMQDALSNDPNILNGQIIFQKDGCNMSKQTPVADALFNQLELLKANQYKVVSVSELIHRSPFEDFGEGHDAFESARKLINSGYIVAYKNNNFYPSRKLTFGELVTMSTPKTLYIALAEYKYKHRLKNFDSSNWNMPEILKADVNLKSNHPYYMNFKYAKQIGYLDDALSGISPDQIVTLELANAYLKNIATINHKKILKLEGDSKVEILRSEITPYLCDVLPLEAQKRNYE